MTETSMSTRFALLALVAVVQIGLLGKIVYDRVSLLRTGREIVMPIVPVDPRDLFRGDYVTLGYPVSQIVLSDLSPRADFKDLTNDHDVYVVVRPAADQAWKPVAVSPAYPDSVADGDAVLKGRVTSIWKTPAGGDDRILVRYGVERYFVPEGTGRALEDKVQERSMQALLAVGGDGTLAIKGLLIGDERHEDPPLF